MTKKKIVNDMKCSVCGAGPFPYGGYEDFVFTIICNACSSKRVSDVLEAPPKE